MKNRVEVEILGNLYNLRTDSSPEYINKIAGYLNSKINEMSVEGMVLSSSDKSVLAALNITDELFKLRDNVDKKYRKLFDKTSNLINHIEKQIE